jgi:hypothetical protein
LEAHRIAEVPGPSGHPIGDFIITAAEELDQADAMAEGIRENDDLAPRLDTNFGLGPRACLYRAG